MRQFCRHNRLVQNCPICSREQEIEARPLISSSAPRTAEPRRDASSPRRPREPRTARTERVTVRRLRNYSEDGFHSPLVPGLRSSEEARRLAEELTFAQSRLDAMAASPPGLYAEVADPGGDLEERTWLAFLIAYFGPLEAVADPFAEIAAARTPWGTGEPPEPAEIRPGPRGSYAPGRPAAGLAAYRAWAQRAGSQAKAIEADSGWSPERRFARIYERLALPGLSREARFEFLVSLGVHRLYELHPATLVLGGADSVTLAAKRALGIGDPLLLERRAARLAAECGVSLASLDLGFYNWEQGSRARVGLPAELGLEPGLVNRVSAALGLPAESETSIAWRRVMAA